jgi:hypothetical protein
MNNAEFIGFAKHIQSMYKLTKVELVNTYWTYANEISETKRLAFIIRGNAQWKSESSEGIFDVNYGVWLKSNIYDSNGQIDFHQIHSNNFEIWGTINVDIDPMDSTNSRLNIEQALEKVTSITNTLSLIFGISLRWYPARYLYINLSTPNKVDQKVTKEWRCISLPRSFEEQTSIVIDDESISKYLFPNNNIIEGLPSDIRTVIRTAIDWHASGNYHLSGLNRFLNYWKSIELLAHYFYRELPAQTVGRKTKRQKKDAIIKILENEKIEENNCMDLVKICNEIRNPTIREKIQSFLFVIKAPDGMKNTLFEPDEMSEKSLYSIRNDIVHGKLSEHHFNSIELFTHKLTDIQKMSIEIITLSIMNKNNLIQSNE